MSHMDSKGNVIMTDERMREALEMLQAVRDHFKFEANSDGGIVARIDRVLSEALSPPARRTSYEFEMGGDRLSVAWSIPNKSWALFVRWNTVWHLVGISSGQSFTLATEMARILGLEKEDAS